VTRPAGCGAALTCACAAATLCPTNYTCSMPANDLVCTSPPVP
jgi:hypothetical protein